MSDDEAMIAMALGFALMVVGFTLKQFYAAKGIYSPALGKPIPRWQGRLIFVGIGVVFLAFGVAHFVFVR